MWYYITAVNATKKPVAWSGKRNILCLLGGSRQEKRNQGQGDGLQGRLSRPPIIRCMNFPNGLPGSVTRQEYKSLGTVAHRTSGLEEESGNPAMVKSRCLVSVS